MPPLPAVPKVIRINLIHSYGVDLSAEVRFFLQFPGAEPDVSVLETFATSVGGTWAAYLADLMTTGGGLEQVNVTDLSSDSAPSVEVPSVQAGTRDGAGLSADASVVSSILIPRRYRGGHPRTYWPFGIQSDLLSPQTWTSDFVSSAESGIGEFLGNVTTGGWPDAGTLNLMNVSYYHGFTPYQNPITGRWRNVPDMRATPIIDTATGQTVRSYVGSQRRRQHPR